MKATMLILSLAALVGCKSVAAEREAPKQARLSKFESAMWEFFKDSVDKDIRKEKGGGQPTAGHKTWRTYWMWSAELARKSKEGGQRRIDYIIEQRRKAGLPEIPELYFLSGSSFGGWLREDMLDWVAWSPEPDFATAVHKPTKAELSFSLGPAPEWTVLAQEAGHSNFLYAFAETIRIHLGGSTPEITLQEFKMANYSGDPAVPETRPYTFMRAEYTANYHFTNLARKASAKVVHYLAAIDPYDPSRSSPRVFNLMAFIPADMDDSTRTRLLSTPARILPGIYFKGP